MGQTDRCVCLPGKGEPGLDAEADSWQLSPKQKSRPNDCVSSCFDITIPKINATAHLGSSRRRRGFRLHPAFILSFLCSVSHSVHQGPEEPSEPRLGIKPWDICRAIYSFSLRQAASVCVPHLPRLCSVDLTDPGKADTASTEVLSGRSPGSSGAPWTLWTLGSAPFQLL